MTCDHPDADRSCPKWSPRGWPMFDHLGRPVRGVTVGLNTGTIWADPARPALFGG